MKGLELSEAYYREYEPELKNVMGEAFDAVSVGLCGQGSECLGFDDEISRDHDFGPGFCIFTDQKLYEEYGEALWRFYRSLPEEFMGMKREISSHGEGRVGVIVSEDFYFAALGIDHEPETLYDWYRLDETRLAMATGGRLFHEGKDGFSRMRQTLLSFYPREVLLKKLASRFAVMAQAGQYNYPRCLARKETVAAHFALSLFMKNAISAVYLLNGRYMPFYKWAHHGLSKLPVLGESLSDAFVYLSQSRDGMVLLHKEDGTVLQYEAAVFVEMICGEIAKECVNAGFLSKQVSFLEEGAALLQESLQDELLLRLPLEM